jgi:HSP20 family protein
MLPILSSQIRGADGGSLFSSLRRDVDRLIDEAFTGYPTAMRTGSFLPPVDIEETEDAIRIEVEVPGLRAEDLDVTVENGVLTVSGEKRFERKEGDRDRSRWTTERQFGRFQRSFALPAHVDGESVRANYDSGVLIVELPKRGEARARRINIGTSAQAVAGTARREVGRGDYDREIEPGRSEEKGGRRVASGASSTTSR